MIILEQLLNEHFSSAMCPIWFPGLAERLVGELEPSTLSSISTYSTTRKITEENAAGVRVVNDGIHAVGPVLPKKGVRFISPRWIWAGRVV